MKDRKRVAIWIVFTAYCLMLIYFLFFNGRDNFFDYSFSEYFEHNTNFIPFHYIKGYVRNLIAGERLFDVAVNLLGNVVIFIPLGTLLPIAFKRLAPFGKYIFLAVCIPIVIESIQLIFMVGCFDVDDIILNVLGLSIGYGIYTLVHRRKKKD